MPGRRRIGELLVQKAILSPEQLKEALLTQIVLGRRLGTNLVELYSIDPDVIASALAEQHNIPAALEEDFLQGDKQLQSKLSPSQAAQWQVVPLRTDPSSQNILVACKDPTSPEVLEDLTQLLGGPIRETITSELRLSYYLERNYGVFRPVPLLRVHNADEKIYETALQERRNYVRTVQETSSLGRIALKRVRVPSTPPNDPDTARSWSLSDCLRTIRGATGRDRVADHVMEAMSRGIDKCLDAGAIFVLRKTLAIGWKGFIRDGDPTRFESLAIPLDTPSILTSPVTTGVPWFGTPNPASSDIDPCIWEHLGTAPPLGVGVIPIMLHGRVVCLLYAHTADGAQMSDNTQTILLELSAAMAASFDRLVRAADR